MNSFTPIGSIIESLLRNLSKKGAAREIRIGLLWRKSVGHLLAAKTRLERINHNTLVVRVDNNIWLQELVLRKPDIIRKMNMHLPSQEHIADIYFSLATKRIL